LERPRISTVLLNWNREHLLRVTVESYLATVSVPYELFMVDNASTDESRAFIGEVCRRDPRHRAIFLKRNVGGRALNAGLRRARGEFLHVSENDIEYLPGWDRELLDKFAAFPELGQLSPFGPEPDRAKGEIWDRGPSTPLTRDGRTIYRTNGNITTTGILRRQIWDEGLRWGSVKAPAGERVRLPGDEPASKFIQMLGYWVAWNDRYTVINWGHNVKEWQTNLDYYLGNYQAKPWLGTEGLRRRLRENGYDLVADGGEYRIVGQSRSSEEFGDHEIAGD
jgi:glycosyltransferase involved in cell wall biosynthesis